MEHEQTFTVELTSDDSLRERLVVGIADMGVAGLTAVDYLLSHTDATQVGHVATRAVPDIAPVTDGTPRRPIRLYDSPGADATLLVSEVFLPVDAGDRIAETLFDWLADTAVEEIVVPFGATFPHTEEEHTVFYVATPALRERLADTEIPPLPSGFFDGLVGELVTRGLDDDTPEVGVLVTPAHYPGPDLDGAIRLLDGVEDGFGVSVDQSDLETRSGELKAYYQGLADRMQTLQNESDRDYLADRMYM